MTGILKGSRAGEPIEHIIVGEEPTECGHCGARTEISQVNSDNSRIEHCLHCAQQFLVEDDYNVVTKDEDEPTLPEASEDDVRHLFGLPPRPPEWGTF